MSSTNHRARGKALLLLTAHMFRGSIRSTRRRPMRRSKKERPWLLGIHRRTANQGGYPAEILGPAHESARQISSGSSLQLRKPQSRKARFQQVVIEAYSLVQQAQVHGHFILNFTRNCYLAVELTEQVELLGTREGDEGRGIGDNDHELRRSSVLRSSSRSEKL